MTKPARITSVDEYLAQCSPAARDIMEEIRLLVKRTVPAAREVISYQIPAFRLRRTFFYYAAFKKHIGIYPPVKQDNPLIEELRPYRGEKGNLQFPLDLPMPYELISRVAAALANEYR